MCKSKQIAITGIGVVTANSGSIEELWGILSTAKPQLTEQDHIFMGIAPDIDLKKYTSNRKIKRLLSRGEKIAAKAINEAISFAGSGEEYEADEKGIFLANTKESGPKDSLMEALNKIYDPKRNTFDSTAFAQAITESMSPLFVVEALPNACLHYFSEQYQIKGTNSQFMNNNVAAVHALDAACDALVIGDCSWAVVGGFDSYRDDKLYQELQSNNIVRLYHDPKEYRGPFIDIPFVGEGAGFLVLEDKAKALEYSRTIIGEILGTKQLTMIRKYTDTDNRFLLRKCIEELLLDADLTLECISIISVNTNLAKWGHNLVLEQIADMFSSENTQIYDTQGVVGNTISASAIIELIASILAINKQERLLYSSNNYAGHPLEEFIQFNKPIENMQYALTISIGYEGELGIVLVKGGDLP